MSAVVASENPTTDTDIDFAASQRQLDERISRSNRSATIDAPRLAQPERRSAGEWVGRSGEPPQVVTVGDTTAQDEPALANERSLPEPAPLEPARVGFFGDSKAVVLALGLDYRNETLTTGFTIARLGCPLVRVDWKRESRHHAPDAVGSECDWLEVIETTPDGTWGLVGISEGNGWVNMRFLARSDIFPYELPRPLACIGTEPFWRIGLYPRGDEFEMMGDMRRDLNRVHEAVGENGFLARLEEGPTLERTLIVEKGQCSDGMSDRRYGWHATLFTEAPDGNYVLSGCCTLDGNF
jgi:uncharacterized membrane protein